MSKPQFSKLNWQLRNQSPAAYVVKIDGFTLPTGCVNGFMKT